jgi:hypothetical protein
MNKVIIAASIAVLLGGCASRPMRIPPKHISGANFVGLACDEIGVEYRQAVRQFTSASDDQDTIRNVDSAGVFLILLPVGSMFNGSNSEDRVARSKGLLTTLRVISEYAGCEHEYFTMPKPTRCRGLRSQDQRTCKNDERNARDESNAKFELR